MAKNTKLALTLSTVVFILVFLAHLSRVLLGFDLQIGNWLVPIWFNVIAGVILLGLIYINYKAL